MKEIILTRGKIALVDDEDFDFLSQYSWQAKLERNTFYAGAYTRGANRRYMMMHREIMGLTDPAIFVDHIDQNGLNNQRYNLRVATNAQNVTNRIKRPNASSRYLGVVKRGSGWVAQLKKNYKTEEGAALAYNAGAAKYHGEFATFNIIAKTALANYTNK